MSTERLFCLSDYQRFSNVIAGFLLIQDISLVAEQLATAILDCLISSILSDIIKKSYSSHDLTCWFVKAKNKKNDISKVILDGKGHGVSGPMAG